MNLEDLNESQRRAVLCTDHPSLVIAGAGSGKTRVLTYKIAYLLEQGIKPWNILALTFTNKAAREMRERIGKLVGEELASKLWMGTFHSIFGRILRKEAQLIGFTSQFTIYDATDAKNQIAEIIKQMGLSDKTYKASNVAARISKAKNALVTPQQYLNDSDIRIRDARDNMASIGKIYEQYTLRLRQSNSMDFDDMLLYTWQLLGEHPEVAAKYQEQFEHVLVDEYQDTNYVQHQIVWLLTNHRQRLTVVGDDAQSIYSFRGANINNILRFTERYQEPLVFKLEQNYRSTQNIVGAAGSLIAHNKQQIKKNVFSEQEKGSQIAIRCTQSDIEESIVVTQSIRGLINRDHLSPSEIAILYRTNAQSRSFETELRKYNVPYRIWGGQSFYQRKEIKDFLAYLRLTQNPKDEIALLRVINYPGRGIGDTTMQRVKAQAMSEGVSPWDIIQDPSRLEVTSGTKNKLMNFAAMIQTWHDRAQLEDAYTLAMDIVSLSGIRGELMKGHEPEDISRQENVQEMLDHMSSFVQDKTEEGKSTLLVDYLAEVSLMTDMDENDENESNNEKITLMTIHAAKGLEFDVVYLVGMEETLFPSQMSIDSPHAVEEERRLCYVAMTRARKQLTLTWARNRFRYGKSEMCMPSRFLSEIAPQFIAGQSVGHSKNSFTATRSDGYNSAISSMREKGGFSSTTRTMGSRTSAYGTMGGSTRVGGRLTPLSSHSRTQASSGNLGTDNMVKPGQKVEHARFGRGVVESVTGTGMDAKATVRFENGETRTLLLRFAALKCL